jgi:hypothetical protein
VVRRLLGGALVACAVALGLAVPTGAAAADACEVSPILVNPCRPWLGAASNKYPDVGSGVRAQIEAHEGRIGRQVDIVHSYHPPGSVPLSGDERHFIERPDTMAFINWKPASVWADAAGGNPTVDARIDRAADDIAAVAPAKIFLTIHHEAENDVSAGNCASRSSVGGAGSPDDYRAMWRNVRERFDARGVDNVVWVMDYMNYPPWDCLVHELYPGNDLVDWVMFNGYGGARNPDYVANVQRFYDLLAETSDADHDYLSKPWGIVEWNIRNATAEQGVAYYEQARAALAANLFPRLHAYMIFDSVGPEGNENRVSYTVEGTADRSKQNAYNAFANDPRLTGDGSVPDDAEPPTAVVTTPDGAAPVSGPVAVTAEVADDVGVNAARLLVDGAEVGPDAVPPFTPAQLTWDSTTVRNGVHELQVQVRDAGGNTAVSEVVRVDVRNTGAAPPAGPQLAAPRDVRAVAPSGSSVRLTWSAAGDDAAGYLVVRDGVLRARLGPVTNWTDTGLDDGERYRYQVVAVDAAGNRSAPSAEVAVRTPDLPRPAPPDDREPAVRTAVTESWLVTVSWTPPGNAAGVAGYHVYRDDREAPIATVGPAALAYRDTTVAAGRTYTYRVVAFDGRGNTGDPSAPVGAVTAPATDRVGGTRPADLHVVATRSGNVRLSWTASPDDADVRGYHVYRDGRYVGDARAGTFTDFGLEGDTCYLYRVVAFDSSANVSLPSMTLSATTSP